MAEDIDIHELSDSFDNLEWQPQLTYKQYSFCTSKILSCANSNCNKKLYKGRYRKAKGANNKGKAHKINTTIARNIFAVHNILFRDDAHFCKRCYDKSIDNDIGQFAFDTIDIEVPSFKQLDDIINTIDVDDNKEEEDQENEDDTGKQILLDIDSLSEAEIQICSGFTKQNIQRVLSQTNKLLT